MRKKSVSVIIPCYNVDKYIEDSIKSVINQTQEDIEIICIDDGSSDNTSTILEKYDKQDARIKLIKKKNEGVSIARNIGIKEANGEYLMFLDSDDYIDKNMIKDMYHKAKNRDIDIVKCNRYDVYPKYNRKIERKPVWEKEIFISKENFKDNIYMEILKRNRLCSMCMTMVKSSFIKENNMSFNETLKVDEDAVFSMELFTRAKTFLYIPKPYYFYVKHGKGLSARGVDLLARIESRKEHANLIKKYAEKWELNVPEILDEKIAFIGIYTAFQTTRKNKNEKFFKQYKIFKRVAKENTFSNSIKKSKYLNMLLPEKILCVLIKLHLYFLAYLYGMMANFAIDILRPLLEKYRNKK